MNGVSHAYSLGTINTARRLHSRLRRASRYLAAQSCTCTPPLRNQRIVQSLTYRWPPRLAASSFLLTYRCCHNAGLLRPNLILSALICRTFTGAPPMRYPKPKKNGDKLAVLVLVVFGLCLLAMPFLPAAQRPFNWGFSSDWSCTNQSVEVSCQRK